MHPGPSFIRFVIMTRLLTNVQIFLSSDNIYKGSSCVWILNLLFSPNSHPLHFTHHLLWQICHIPTMYSDAALLAQASSSVHHPISNLTRPDGSCDGFLGKRCTTLNHCVFDLPIKLLDNNARPVKRQTLAIHVNTRHMAQYHSSPGVSDDQCGTLVPVQVSKMYQQDIFGLTKW